mmetsp:Transcript_1391/g.4712  ORF Transcript_1391/g.4712 Transcript_1391/m.4712 type:complete len:245 (+) Transcript_1391:640-1374(+)
MGSFLSRTAPERVTKSRAYAGETTSRNSASFHSLRAAPPPDISPPCHTSLLLLLSSKNPFTCTGKPVFTGRGRKQNARPVGEGGFWSESESSVKFAPGSSAATAAHGTSLMPNRSRPWVTSGCSEVPRACETANCRVVSPSEPLTPPPFPWLKKQTSKFEACGGSIVASAPTDACAADARANAPLATESVGPGLVIAELATKLGTAVPSCQWRISTRVTFFRNNKSRVFSCANLFSKTVIDPPS